MTELLWEDATAQVAAMRAGEVRAVELIEAYLGRIDALDGVVRAYVDVDPALALDAARAADRRRTDGAATAPLDGVAVSVKDVEDVAGLRTTHSCELLADHRATADGPVAARLRSGGFVPIGKSNVPEFCSDMTTSKLNGTSRNPWDLDRTPGGSSGGAAAARAAGMCAVAHGTDGAGSVRVPASFCGLVGIKPTRDLVTFGPDEGNAFFGCAEPGLLTRTVRDLAAALDVLAPRRGWTPSRSRPFADEPGAPVTPVQVGVCTSFLLGEVDPACAAAADDAARLLESLGHHVVDASPRWEVLFGAVGPLEVPSMAALVDVEQAELVEPRNRAGVRDLAGRTVLEHHRWVEAVRTASREFTALWEEIDVLVTPTCGVLPPAADWARWDDDPSAHMDRFAAFPNFAQPFNISGQPAVSLPLGQSPEGLPIGVQLAARKLEEGLLLRLGAQLEEAQPWAHRTVAAGKALDGAVARTLA